LVHSDNIATIPLSQPFRGSCGGNDNGQAGQPSPSWNRYGYELGIGLRPAGASSFDVMGSSSVASGPPESAFATGAWYDLMSYCDQGIGGLQGDGSILDDSSTWLSPNNWEQAMNCLLQATAPPTSSARCPHGTALSPPPSASDSRARAAAAGGLEAIVSRGAGDVSISQIQTRPDGSIPLGGSASDLTLQARDAKGAVVSSAPLRLLSGVHGDHSGNGQLLSAALPAGTKVNSLDVTDGTKILSQVVRPPHPPVVRLRSPQPGVVIGPGQRLRVAWTQKDLDNKPLSAKLAFSSDGGHHWQIVYMGGGTTTTLPRSMFAASRQARLRVTVSDGWNETASVSGVFRTLGAPPRAKILPPATGLRVPDAAGLDLLGQGATGTGIALSGAHLQWFEGRRRLGFGSAVSIRGLAAGRHMIRLVVTDDRGRAGSASLVIVLTATRPTFTLLTAPKRLSRRARSITLRVATAVPALLTIGKHRYSLGPHPRSLRAGISPGRGQLNISLLLTGDGRRLTSVLTVARR
jgi:hypothetical protein